MAQRKQVVYTIDSISLPAITLKSALSKRTVSLSDIRRSDGSPSLDSDLRIGTKVKVYMSLTDKVLEIVIDSAEVGRTSSFKPPVSEESYRRVEEKRLVIERNAAVLEWKKREKPHFYTQLYTVYQSPVLVLSKLIYPISFLGEKYKYSKEARAAYKLIKGKCVGVRKCNAGDANGVWTALSIAFLELLSRVSTPLHFLRFCVSVFSPHLSNPRFCVASSVFPLLERDKVSSSPSGPSLLHSENLCKDISFWRSFSALLEQSAEDYLEVEENAQRLLGLSSQSALFIFRMSSDSQMDIGYRALAERFGLKVVVLSAELPKYKKVYMGEAAEEERKVYLFRDNAMFHVLYTETQLRADGYQMESGKYDRGAAVSATCGKPIRCKKRLEIQPSLHRDLSVSKSALQTLAAAGIALQNTLASLLKDPKARQYSLHTGLSQATLALFRSLTSSQVAMKAETAHLDIPAAVRTEVEQLQSALRCETLSSLARDEELLREMKVCEMCKEKPMSVELECAHRMCQDCWNSFYGGETASGKAILCASGETLPFFRCRIPFCSMKISAERLKLILGEVAFSSLPRETSSQNCPVCSRSRRSDCFEVICKHCSTAICVYCLSACSRNCQQSCHFCQKQYELWAFDIMRMSYITCGQCHKSLPGVEFSVIECEGHTLCQNCLIGCENDCKVCGRHFTNEELNAIDEFKAEICDVCWEECRGNRVEATCMCKICKPCARIKARETRQATRCFVCRAPFPLPTSEFLSPDIVQQLCDYCHEFLPLSTPPQRCGHRFHEKCLEDGIKASAGKRLHCPIESCAAQMSSDDSSEVCPNCKSCAGKGLENTRKCDFCGYLYCRLCRTALGADHSDSLCEFYRTQRLVTAAEKQGKVAQCPQCRHPNIGQADTGSTVECMKCGTSFCFQCSALASGYLAHGNAWHRSQCVSYQSSDRRLCPQCSRPDGRCRPPHDLSVPQRFSLGEN